MLTNQEIFTTSATGLLKQNEQSLKPDNTPGVACRYRSDLGLRCAAGFLIPDSHYRKHIEGSSVAALGESNSGFWTSLGIDRIGERLLGQLQEIHDSEAPEHWRSHLTSLAEEWNLEMPQTEPKPEIVAIIYLPYQQQKI